VEHLDALVELGLGIHRRLNEECLKLRQSRVDRSDVSFWYLANHLGRRFLRDAQELLGPLTPLGAGVWRVAHLHRSLILVSGRMVPVDRDSLAVHALAVEPEEQKRTLVNVLRQNLDLWPTYAAWLAGAYPALAKEIADMGKTKSKKKFVFDFRPFFEEVGWKEVIRQVGIKSFIDEVGLSQIVAQLTPQQRQVLQLLLQKTPPEQ